MIGLDPESFFFQMQFAGAKTYFDALGYADYLTCAKDPSVIHAMCEDYRAGATFDRLADDTDQANGKKLQCPVQILWGSRGALEKWYDVLGVWRDWADDVVGSRLDCGHFIPEEEPELTAAAFLDFFQR